jgi:transmembrane sensor
MKLKKTYHSQDLVEKLMDAPPELDLNFEKSKEEIWNCLEANMHAPSIKPQRSNRSKKMVYSWAGMSVAAALILALGTGLFFRLYTKTVFSAAGEHLTAFLPDGSMVKMNADSEISYKPFWWRFERKVDFQGEAFFKVKHGETFTVVSSFGTTTVLGTTFNIYARKKQYMVTCYTGKVRVLSPATNQSLDIESQQQASVNRDGTLKLKSIDSGMNEAPWISNMFFFTGTPVEMVFDEIERQFDVSIKVVGDIEGLLYSGNFSRDLNVEEVLQMVSRSFALEYNHVNGVYVIQKK